MPPESLLIGSYREKDSRRMRAVTERRHYARISMKAILSPVSCRRLIKSILTIPIGSGLLQEEENTGRSFGRSSRRVKRRPIRKVVQGSVFKVQGCTDRSGWTLNLER